MRVHTKAIRALVFSHDGRFVFTGSSDKTIRVTSVASGKVLHTVLAAHPAAINVVSINPDGTKLFTGDDEGEIRVWDISPAAVGAGGSFARKPLHAWHVHHDFISCLVNPPSSRYLIAGSGDGCLSGWNLATGDVDGVSANLNDEVLSVCALPNKKHVLCGTQGGVVQVFDWGAWGQPVRSYRGHPHSIESILAVDNNTIVTASSDGLIRVVQLHPHKILGIVGDHEDLPAERLRLNAKKTLLLSTSHDEMVHFWDVRILFEEEDEAELERENEAVADEEIHGTDVAADGCGDSDSDDDDDDDDDDGDEDIDISDDSSSSDDDDDDGDDDDDEEMAEAPKKKKKSTEMAPDADEEKETAAEAEPVTTASLLGLKEYKDTRRGKKGKRGAPTPNPNSRARKFFADL